MSRITTTKLIRHRWTDLFSLVLDVESYPQFVPHCREVRLLSRDAEPPARTVIISRMVVGFSAFHVGYANRTVGDAAARRISVEALDGPLRRLDVVWSFAPKDEHRTEVAFAAEFEFGNRVLGAVASGVFNTIFGEILGAFERRADALFGPTAR